MADLDIQTENVDGSLVVRPIGELDLASAPALSAVLLNQPRDGLNSLVLDLSGLTFLDSSGLRVIVAAHRHAVREGYGFSLTSVTPAIARRFKITGLDTLIPIRPTATE